MWKHSDNEHRIKMMIIMFKLTNNKIRGMFKQSR